MASSSSIEQIIDGSEVDERSRPLGIQSRDLLEMVRGADQVLELEADRRQAIMNVWGVRLDGQRFHVQLPSLVRLALDKGLGAL